jgi:hypothetical protein
MWYPVTPATVFQFRLFPEPFQDPEKPLGVLGAGQTTAAETVLDRALSPY